MKKIAITALLILVIGGVIAPVLNGILMEKVVKRTLGDLNRMNSETGNEVRVEILEYKRTLRSSVIRWKIDLGSLEEVYGIGEVELVERAKHGITGVVSQTSLEKNNWYTDAIDKKLGGKDPLTITTDYSVVGNIESKIELDGFTLVDGEVEVEIKPAVMITSFNEGFQNVSSQMSWEGFTLPGKVSASGLTFNSDLAMITTFIWDGKASFGVSTLDAVDEESQEQFKLKNLKGGFVMGFDEKSNRVSIGVEYGVDSLMAGVEKLENAEIKFDVNGMDADGYERFIKLYIEIINGMKSEIMAAQNDPAKLQQLMNQQMATAGLQMVGASEKLLKKGFGIRISNLKAKLEEGDIEGNLSLSLKKDMTMAQFIPLLGQPELVVDIFDLNSELRFPRLLAGDATMLLSPMYPGMQSGIFVEEGNNLVHKSQIRDGKIFLNGEEILFNN